MKKRATPVQFKLRLPETLYRVVAEAARFEDKSLNGYLNRIIDRAMYDDEVMETLDRIEALLKKIELAVLL